MNVTQHAARYAKNVSDVEEIGGMKAITILETIQKSESRVMKTVNRKLDQITPKVEQLSEHMCSLVGYSDSFGKYVPGRLDKLDESLTRIVTHMEEDNRSRAEERRQRTETELRRHREWQEGEEVRQAIRDAVDSQAAEMREVMLEELKALRAKSDEHDRKLQSMVMRSVGLFMRVLKRMQVTRTRLVTFWTLVSSATGLTIGIVWIWVRWLAVEIWRLIKIIAHHI